MANEQWCHGYFKSLKSTRTHVRLENGNANTMCSWATLHFLVSLTLRPFPSQTYADSLCMSIYVIKFLCTYSTPSQLKSACQVKILLICAMQRNKISYKWFIGMDIFLCKNFSVKWQFTICSLEFCHAVPASK